MAVNKENYYSISEELKGRGAALVAVSKTKPVEDIMALYEMGQRDFGENYVQEMVDKAARLPADIRWHYIGHLQTNKAKYIAPIVHLVHGVDSLKLLKEISKQAEKSSRTIDLLLQVHIAREETKFGFNAEELASVMNETQQFASARVRGLMGMASFTEDQEQIRAEFGQLKKLFDQYREERRLELLSMGMSNDYRLALDAGSNMVRIGSLLFGERRKN